MRSYLRERLANWATLGFEGEDACHTNLLTPVAQTALSVWACLPVTTWPKCHRLSHPPWRQTILNLYIPEK